MEIFIESFINKVEYRLVWEIFKIFLFRYMSYKNFKLKSFKEIELNNYQKTKVLIWCL